MHIALVTPCFPTPTAVGYRRRIARFSCALAQRGQVHLFSALEAEDLLTERSRCGGGFDPYARVVTSAIPEADSRGFTARLGRTFPQSLGRALAASYDASPFDVVVVMNSVGGTTVPDSVLAPIVLDEPVVPSGWGVDRHASGVQGAIDRVLFHAHRHDSEPLLKRADAIVVARPRDVATVRMARPDMGVLIHNGVDAKTSYLPPSRRKENTVLFVVTGEFPAALQQAEQLVGKVMPRVRRHVPEAMLTLASHALPQEFRWLEDDYTRVASGISSVESLLRDHAVYVIPQLPTFDEAQRVLEPMAHGMPVVASRTALWAYPLVEDQHYLGAKSNDELAEKLVIALRDPSKLDPMALAARKVAEQYDWQILGDQFVRVVMAAMARKSVR